MCAIDRGDYSSESSPRQSLAHLFFQERKSNENFAVFRAGLILRPIRAVGRQCSAIQSSKDKTIESVSADADRNAVSDKSEAYPPHSCTEAGRNCVHRSKWVNEEAMQDFSTKNNERRPMKDDFKPKRFGLVHIPGRAVVGALLIVGCDGQHRIHPAMELCGSWGSP